MIPICSRLLRAQLSLKSSDGNPLEAILSWGASDNVAILIVLLLFVFALSYSSLRQRHDLALLIVTEATRIPELQNAMQEADSAKVQAQLRPFAKLIKDDTELRKYLGWD